MIFQKFDEDLGDCLYLHEISAQMIDPLNELIMMHFVPVDSEELSHNFWL